MSYSCICVQCNQSYAGGPKEEALLSNPEYSYDPTDFECTPCLDAEQEARDEEIIQQMMEDELWHRMIEEEGDFVHH